jgi:hypothetical protein
MFNYIVKPSNDLNASYSTNGINKSYSESSNVDLIDESELSFDALEPGTSDQYQIYFKNIEVLYDYLKVNQVEVVKEKTQFYIHNMISPSILDCVIIADSLEKDGNKLSFMLLFSDKSTLNVELELDGANELVDVNIIHITDRNI